MDDAAWGPWIEHDGGKCPLLAGVVIQAIFHNSQTTEGRMNRPHLAYGWRSDGPKCAEFHDHVKSYRIRTPRALADLRALIADQPLVMA